MAEAAESSTLTWRDARRDDRGALKAFVCTSPDRATWIPIRRRRYHPRQWELDAQATVRSMKPPAQNGERIRLAFDGDGLAAVVHVTSASHGDFGLTIPIAALAQRLRHGKSRYGDELMDEALRVAAEMRSRLNESVGVFARVHPKNLASKRMLERAGFSPAGLIHQDPPTTGPDPHHRCVECVESWVADV
ncbi:GNAT family N-acetyltransferase [Cellulomonas sp. Leaf395]|uniref:GNAT family N-acetyltransferase n=1 Tax=Cellulomonas sp. Leaf395 TaxID=1736362 RepID=UPI003FA44E7B